jgi:hypothetical protein
LSTKKRHNRLKNNQLWRITLFVGDLKFALPDFPAFAYPAGLATTD